MKLELDLGIDNVKLESQSADKQGSIVLRVKSTKEETRCKNCGQKARIGYGYAAEIKVRHLSVFDTPTYIVIQPARYKCEHCNNVSTEEHDWFDPRSKTTKALDQYLSRMVINSTIADVAKKERIGYKSVVSAINRQVNKEVDWEQYEKLGILGIDEISNKKGHQEYYTIISSKTADKLSVIAVLTDRKKETVKEFLESIPKHLKKTVDSVCTDMYDGFVNSAKEVFGEQKVVIDRFHVAKLYREPLDKLRVKEMRRLKAILSPEEYAELEGMMWVLRKKHELLTADDKRKLKKLYKYSPMLKQAHSLALKLTHIFNSHGSRKSSLTKINRWVAKIERSNLKCFDKFIVTANKYLFGILNYFKKRKNSGFVEGLNNKIKLIKRRCYGFFKVESFFQRLVLDLTGYDRFMSIN